MDGLARPRGLLVLLLLLSCVGPEGSNRTPASRPSPAASPSPTAAEPRPGGPVDVRLVRVASIRNAVGMAALPGASRIYVASRGGRIFVVDDGGEPRKVLDLAREVSCCEEEQGMFDLAAEPDGSALYASFSDTTGALRVVSVPMVLGRLQTGSPQDLLSIPQASPRHHGGSLEIGPGGHLFIGTGDGVLDLDPRNRAQSLGSLRGKLLRIDPHAGGETYAVPSSNPFLDRPGARPEIFARGLRNPWRFSFDRATGDLWLADVGRYEVEEINFLPAGTGAGANLGWDRMEGTRRVRGRRPRDHTPPVFEYAHRGGRCAVIGGYVYRGTRIPNLGGVYVYGDLCDGRVRTLTRKGRNIVPGPPLDVQVDALTSFGEDAEGELYLLSLYRGVYRLVPRV
jgi:glucose/arabinose dehydrogenase